MQVVRQLPMIEDDRILVGPGSIDDAGVYRLTDEVAIIQTVDFITPVVDDPYMFGQITVANSLSDVYAMGGKPITALNVVGFPVGILDLDILTQILKGGIEKMKEANVALMGGHTIDDRELKYGLAVTGTVHPDRIVSNAGAKPGDVLLLTKPVGIGVVTTGIKAGMVETELADLVTEFMAMLNDKAAEAMIPYGAPACTDITGFGLLGHASEMMENSNVGFHLIAKQIPLFSGAVELADQGVLPGGSMANREFYSKNVMWESSADIKLQPVLYDAQTSGGLLIAVEGAKSDDLLERLHKEGIVDAAVIGEVIPEPAGKIIVS